MAAWRPSPDLPHVGEIRQRGLMVGIELVRRPGDEGGRSTGRWPWANASAGGRASSGMITRPLGDVVTFVPPLATEESDLEAMLDILEQAVAEGTEGAP